MRFSYLTLILVLSSVKVWAANSASDTVRFSVDVPQYIAINSPTDPHTASVGDTMSVTWQVNSNFSFKYHFSGTAKSDDGSDITYPVLHKQDIDASGNLVANRYDHLDTSAGITLSNYESVQILDMWGAGSNAGADIADLVRPETDPDSPVGTTGRIMPGDNTSMANITLYLKGIADQFDQSGLYNSEVMLTVTADDMGLL